MDRLQSLAKMERWHFWFEGRRGLLKAFVKAYLEAPPGSWVLELGCGTGNNLKELTPNTSVRRLGIDCHREGFGNHFNEGPSLYFLQGEGLQLPLQNEMAQGVFLLDILEHVDDRRLLSEVHRVLKPEGKVFLTVPACPWLWSFRDEDAGHRRRYTRTLLTKTLEEAGFEVDRMVFYQFFLFPLVLMTRILGRKRSSWRDSEERPHPVLNKIFKWVNRWEAQGSKRISWPWGSSLLAVCHKHS